MSHRTAQAFTRYVQRRIGSVGEAALDDGDPATGPRDPRAGASTITVAAGKTLLVHSLTLASHQGAGGATFRFVNTANNQIAGLFTVGPGIFSVFLETSGPHDARDAFYFGTYGSSWILALSAGTFRVTVEQPGGAAFSAATIGGLVVGT